MSELLADTISQVKKISTRLRPGVLDHLGLDAAIEWQAQEFEERSQIKCNIDLNLNGRQIDKKKSTAMFRIFQEALTNILRHSQATEVDIKLGINDDLIELSISDNGIGILDNQIENKKSFGLIGMRERAESLKGSLKIKTKRLEGTQVLVYLPLSN